MILLLGASGFVGQAFATELRWRRLSFVPLTRKAIDYTQFEILFDYIRKMRPEFIINAAGYAPNPNVDVCELAREEVLCANVLLPQTIARACLMTNTPWGHVSSGSIYLGAKVVEGGQVRIERDLNHPEMRRRLVENPDSISGFSERDIPNFSFRRAPCNFYSGTKALAEEAIRGVGQNYIWRPRMLFNDLGDNRNLLWKLQRYPKVYDTVNSITHLEEFVRACLDLWERQAPFGIYNVVNPGAVTNRQIVGMIQRILKSNRHFEFWKDDTEFYRSGAKMLRSSCLLDIMKLSAFGVKMRPVEEAVEDALQRWRPMSPFAEFVPTAHGAQIA